MITTVTKLAIQTVAESLPGWNEPSAYDANREWLVKNHSHVPLYTDDEFERALAQMNKRLDGINQACIEQATLHVHALLNAGFVITKP